MKIMKEDGGVEIVTFPPSIPPSYLNEYGFSQSPELFQIDWSMYNNQEEGGGGVPGSLSGKF